MKSYIEKALRTKSDKFHTEQFSPWEIVAVLKAAIEIGVLVDQIKKGLFYGKPCDDVVFNNFLREGLVGNCDSEIVHLNVDVIHSILGSFTESTELLELLVGSMESGLPIDPISLMDETGDQMWYLAIMMNALETSFEEVGERNIRKLMARFPAKFDETRANVRNLEEERKALTSVK